MGRFKTLLSTLLLSSTALVAKTIDIPADYPTIQAGINAAESGDTVLVQPGLYMESVDFRGIPIVLTGTAPHDPEVVAATRIDGSNTHYFGVVCFFHDEDQKTVLTGLTIQNGKGAIYSCAAGSIECDHGASPTIDHCIIRGGFGLSSGGIYLDESNAVISHCVIQNNHSRGGGGGIAIYDGAPRITHCVIRDNRARFGGGIYSSGSNAEIRNCVITANEGKSGGGVYKERAGADALLSVYNCTIVDNMLTSGEGGGVCGPMIIGNSIIWGNQDQQIIEGAQVHYSDIESGYSGVGNIDADPLFFALRDYDYIPGVGSPCIDAGDPAVNDGISGWHPLWPAWYPDGERSDMGAYGGPFNRGWIER
jgi:hypothetical protein